jgi:Ca-activated chloride channel family protein
MQQDKSQTINVQKINVSDKYLIGKYDLEILTLPRTYISVDVTQNNTSNVDIMAPGLITYSTNQTIVAQIFVIRENGMVEWVCNIDENLRSGSIYLQPGNYRFVYRQKKLKSSSYTIEKNFRINSNKTTSINI